MGGDDHDGANLCLVEAGDGGNNELTAVSSGGKEERDDADLDGNTNCDKAIDEEAPASHQQNNTDTSNRDTTQTTVTIEQNPKAKAVARTMQNRTKKEYVFVVCMGMSMAFIAGYSNAVCLSGYMEVQTRTVRQSVAGVTGLYTMSAINLGDGDFDEYWFNVGTFMSVMVGACISGAMNPRPIAFELSPRYGPTFVVGAIFTTLGAIEALHNFRSEFFLTAIGNGIMNGISSMYTANLIRVSHLTGTTTDIGLFVGQLIRGNRTNLWKLCILAGLATSFWVGSMTGYEASKFKRQRSLIMNAVFFYALGFAIIMYFIRVHNVSICDALFGIGKFSWKFQKVKVRKRRTNAAGAEDESMLSGELLVSERELMEIFDSLDKKNDGRVNQDQLMDMLAANDMSVRRQRKTLLGMLHSLFEERDKDIEGDWTIQRQDWLRLVREESTRSKMGFGLSDRSGNNSTSRTTGSSWSPSGNSASSASRRRVHSSGGGALASMELLRMQSIQEIEASGFALREEFEEEEE